MKLPSKVLYPNIEKLGISIKHEEGVAYIPTKELHKVLKKLGLEVQFSTLFGFQTCHSGGAYAWDVEAVLERMVSGKKTGSQLLWD